MGRPSSDVAARWTWPDWLLLAALATPFVVAAVALLAGPYADASLVGDNAINLLRVSDVGRHAVLTGPFSRGTWSHPGPALYYLLAVPYRLLGGRPSGLLVGALAINAASALYAAVQAHRLGGRLLMALVTIALAVLLQSLGPAFVRDPWNPYVTVLPFGAFLVSAWSLATGRWWQLPVAAVLASFCVQSHIGYVPLVAPIVVWALVAAYLSDRRARVAEHAEAPTPPYRRPATAVLVTTAALALLWILPLVDQLVGTGNLEQARAYLMAGRATKGIGVGLRVVGDAFSVGGGWVTGAHPATLAGEPISVHATPAPIVAVVFAVAAVCTWRRQDRTARLGAVMLAIAAAAAVLAVTETTGLLYDYRLRFLWLLTAFTAATTMWLLLRLTPRRTREIAALVVTVVAVGALVRPAVAASTSDPPTVGYVRRMEALARQVIAALPPDTGPYLVRAAGIAGGYYQAALMQQLEAHGRSATVDDYPFYRLALGAHRVQHGRAAGTLAIAVGPDAATVATRNGFAPIAVWLPGPSGRLGRDLAELRRLAAAGPQTSTAARRRIARLLRDGRSVVVFRADATPTPAPTRPSTGPGTP